MKIPLDWLKEYVNLPKSIGLLCDRLTMAGHMLDKIEKVGEEIVIDLELRGNRADCYSILGIAREVACLFEAPINKPLLFKNLTTVSQLKNIQIKVESEYVKRVMAVVLKNVKIEPSPKWLKKRLIAYGIPPINNIVDLTNYVMVETGQPMHAFDLDLIKPKVEIRLAEVGEKIITFEGVSLTTSADDLVWTKGKNLLSIAGAIGSKDFSILSSTNNILLEAANYDQSNIRRSCQKHKLNTEAGIRHEKALDPNLVEIGIKRFLQIFQENNWGEIEPIVYDYYPKPRKPLLLKLSYKKLKEISGFKINPKIIKKIFLNLGIKIKKENPQELTVICPTFRTDLTEEADLIEEILRIYGYEKIPSKLLSLEIPRPITPPFISKEKKLKEVLVSLGFDEVISSSFIEEKHKSINNPLFLKDQKTSPVMVINPPSPDFQQMRMSLLPNLLECCQKAINEREKLVMFFEIGKIYLKNNKTYQEKRRLGIIFCSLTEEGEKFLKFKGYLEALLRSIGLQNPTFKENKLFNKGFFIYLQGKEIGLGGQIEREIFYTEFDLEEFLEIEQSQLVTLWPKFPPIIEDLSFKIRPKTPVGNLIELIKNSSPMIRDVQLIDSHNNFRTLRITYLAFDRTLTDKEVEKIRQKAIEKAEKYVKAKLKSSPVS